MLIVKRFLPEVTAMSAAVRSEARVGGGLGLGRGQVGLDRLGDRGARSRRRRRWRRACGSMAARVASTSTIRPSTAGWVWKKALPFGRLTLASTGSRALSTAMTIRRRRARSRSYSAIGRTLVPRIRLRTRSSDCSAIGAAATDREGGVEHGVEVIVSGDGVVGQGDRLAVDGHGDLARRRARAARLAAPPRRSPGPCPRPRRRRRPRRASPRLW